jgi:predicted ATPase
VRAAEPHFALDRRLAAVITAICRRLDGIPLAIELAAARVGAPAASRSSPPASMIASTWQPAYGIAAAPKVAATLDWSYELLPERVLLRHLAVFAGVFSLEAVAARPEFAPPEVIDGLANLVAKSSSRRRPRGKSRATACSIRRGPSRSRSSARAATANGSRAATPNFTALCSSGRWPLSGSERTGTRAAK